MQPSLETMSETGGGTVNGRLKGREQKRKSIAMTGQGAVHQTTP